MTRETYQQMMEYFKKNEKKRNFIVKTNRLLAGIVFLSYALYLLLLWMHGKYFLLWQAIVVPAVSFVIVTILRKTMNVPRPYEKYQIAPVIEKKTSGKSFPSRHVFSVFVIAVTVGVSCPAAGMVLGIIGIFIAVIRVIGGVHTAADVAAGAVVGILSGMIGYYL